MRLSWSVFVMDGSVCSEERKLRKLRDLWALMALVDEASLEQAARYSNVFPCFNSIDLNTLTHMTLSIKDGFSTTMMLYVCANSTFLLIHLIYLPLLIFLCTILELLVVYCRSFRPSKPYEKKKQELPLAESIILSGSLYSHRAILDYNGVRPLWERYLKKKIHSHLFISPTSRRRRRWGFVWWGCWVRVGKHFVISEQWGLRDAKFVLLCFVCRSEYGKPYRTKN